MYMYMQIVKYSSNRVLLFFKNKIYLFPLLDSLDFTCLGPVLYHSIPSAHTCLLYTSDAADDMQCVDLGGRRIIKKNAWDEYARQRPSS